MTPDTLAILKICGIVILLAPLAGAVLAGGLAPILRGRAHWPTILGVGIAFAAAICVFVQVRGFDSENVTALIPVYDWISNGTASAFRV